MADNCVSEDYALSLVETEFGPPDEQVAFPNGQATFPNAEITFPDQGITANYPFETIPRNFEKKQHHALTLEVKMQVLKDSDAGLSHRQLATKYQCGKTQIGTIVKQKEELLKEWENNAHRGRKRKRSEPYEVVNDMVWNWFQTAKSNQLPINGPILQAKAKEYAYLLEVPNFSASNGWLNSFCRRHNISFRRMRSKNDGCDTDEIHNWKSGMASVLNGYSPRDIYSFHETGLFFQCIPNEILVTKSKMSEGGNLASERLTVALCCNSVGEKEIPLVISSHCIPWCLKDVDSSQVGVKWHRNKRAWLTKRIFNEFLSTLNEKMKAESRKIILFAYDVPCHHSSSELSNVLVKFLPTCFTAVTQPLNLGIIYAFKLLYRKKLLKTLISRVGNSESMNEIANQISLMQVIRWITSSWRAVKPELVTKCFKISGIMNDFKYSVRDIVEYDSEFLTLCQLAGISNIEINEDVQCFQNADSSLDGHDVQNTVCPANTDSSSIKREVDTNGHTVQSDLCPVSKESSSVVSEELEVEGSSQIASPNASSLVTKVSSSAISEGDSSDDDDEKEFDLYQPPFPLDKSISLVSHLRGIFQKHCLGEKRFYMLNTVDFIEEELEHIIIKTKLAGNVEENS